MDWLPGRPAVIALAVAGGLLSLGAIAMRRAGRDAPWPARLDAASYAFMGASVFLFIANGLLATGA